jgi:molybdate transport system regulatory protein
MEKLKPDNENISKMEVKWRIWIEKDGKHVIGKGGAEILKAIKEEGSIAAASKKLGMSYKYIWNYLRKIENSAGDVVEKVRGGKEGGKTVLTPLGEEILDLYELYEKLALSIFSGNFMEGVVKEGKIVVENGLKDGEEVIVLKKKSAENP